MPLSSGEVALVGTLSGLAGNLLPRLLNAVFHRQVEARRLSLESVRAKQVDLDASYVRLERENVRLSEEVSHLRERLEITTTRLEREIDDHDKTRRWCQHLEQTLRLLNIQPSRDDLRPPGEAK